MIVGIGTDIIEINRIKKIIYKYGEKFKKRCFTKDEIQISEKRFNNSERLKYSLKLFKKS